MKSAPEDSSVPVFEIDQPAVYGQYFIRNPVEILSTLRAMERRRCVITVYLDAGETFFLSVIVAIDEDSGEIFLDPSNQSTLNLQASKSQQLTLSATLDKVKIQIRLPALQVTTQADKPAFSVPMPSKILRLQRREFFRLITPHAPPLRCKISAKRDNSSEIFDLPLFDISGGGLSLIANINLAEKFTPGELFQDCRLEIPGESVLSVNLQVREIFKIELANGDQQLRLGCEFVSLPGTRLALIERYVTRLERERKARIGVL
jgi:c-di-GMP-binding flagellar brake protein YcgR